MVLLFRILIAAALAVAHPGESIEHKRAELKVRNDYIRGLQKTDLAHCAPKLHKRGEMQGMSERRVKTLNSLRRKRGLHQDGLYHRIKRQAPPLAPPGPPEVTPDGSLPKSLPPGFPPWFPSGPPGAGFPPPFPDFSFLGPLFNASWNGTWNGTKVKVPDFIKKSHKSKLSIIDPLKTDWALLGQNRTVILSPEVTEGPYYVSGERIRKSLQDGEKGIELFLDIQIVDISTCQPVKDLAVEVWSANSTGVYSSVIDIFSNNTNVFNSHALRGVQISDKEGAVQFNTLVPGHYDGRAVHIHVATHLNATINKNNNTIKGGSIPHIGQLYFDQDLVDEISKLEPYSLNTDEAMKNEDDFLVMEGGGGGSDPVLEYVLLGKSVSDGIFAWINFGIDLNKKKRVVPATVCTEKGCAQNEKVKLLTDLISSFIPGGIPKGLGKGKFPKMGKPMGPPPGPIPDFADILDALGLGG